MLTTRCPECQTTFRITSTVLHTAAGEVRCGHCREIFNAFDSLTDTRRPIPEDARHDVSRDMQQVSPAESHDGAPTPAVSEEQDTPVAEASPELDEAPAQDSLPLWHTSQPDPRAEERAVEPADPGDATLAALEAPAHEAPQSGEPETAEPGQPQPIEPERLSAETPEGDTIGTAEARPPMSQPWRPLEHRATESVRWRLAAALAALLFAGQAIHHFRAPLAQIPYLGQPLERIYAMSGNPIEYSGSPRDFVIVDWAATAQQTNAAQPGKLEITAGVRNVSKGPLSYPLLLLELTDRWEKVIGSRVFSPAEYMGTAISQDSRIAPQTTVNARLNLVDPGPEAYGFEVDVCVPAGSGRMRCKSDLVFE